MLSTHTHTHTHTHGLFSLACFSTYIMIQVKIRISSTGVYYNCLCTIILFQNIQDWHLLVLAVGIIMIEITYTIPILAVIYINGDA